MHRDKNTQYPSTVTIIRGGIGKPSVTMKIVAQPGKRVNSIFSFYTVDARNSNQNRISNVIPLPRSRNVPMRELVLKSFFESTFLVGD